MARFVKINATVWVNPDHVIAMWAHSATETMLFLTGSRHYIVTGTPDVLATLLK